MGTSSELYKVITLKEAAQVLRPYVMSYFERTEKIPLEESLSRVIAIDIPANGPVPNFRKSTVDGIAVRAAETFGASESLPALIQSCGEIFMGEIPEKDLGAGEGMMIPTGGMLPDSADAVVMIEYLENYGDGLYGITKTAAPGENVIQIGEDLNTGEVIIPRFMKIRPQEMGLLAAQGIIKVPVVPKLRIGILSTGDEIIDPSREPAQAQSRDINGYSLLGQALEAGAKARYYGIIGDDYEALRSKLELMLAENDIVMLSGGSSVGVRDHSAELITELGSPGLLFHGLALRPGKPTIGGVAQGKIILGLPGHPASAMIVFQTLIRPLLDAAALFNKSEILPEAILTQNIYSGSGREEYIRVRLIPEGERWLAEPIRGKSGLIRTMVLAQGLVHIPIDTEGIEAGQKVKVYLLG